MDATGMTQNTAARVEQAFDKINPFEEIAARKSYWKNIRSTCTNRCTCNSWCKSIATKLATKALQAKKLELRKFKGKNLKKGMEQVYKLNDKARYTEVWSSCCGWSCR